MDHLIVETPEQIPLEFPLAGIGSRFLALALDTFFQVIAGVTLAFIAIVIASSGSGVLPKKAWLWAILILLAFLLQFGYFAFFEAVWNGQTPGKRLARLRVIHESGRPITAYEAVARNLLRIVDSLPGLYGVGIISALLSNKSKRLGDYVAGTVVVHEKPAVLETGVKWDAAPATGISRYDVARLTTAEFQLIEAFLLRRSQLAPETRVETARHIVQRIAGRLELTQEDARKTEPLLEALARSFRARARFG